MIILKSRRDPERSVLKVPAIKKTRMRFGQRKMQKNKQISG